MARQTSYGILDADGNIVTVGIADARVWKVAQRVANERNESVTVYVVADADADGVEGDDEWLFEPEARINDLF